MAWQTIKKYKEELITWIGALIAVLFMIRIGYSNAVKLFDWEIALEYDLAMLATLVLILVVIYRALIWRYIINALDEKATLSLGKSFDIFVYSWISRYIPGNVGPIIGKAHFGKDTNHTYENLYLSGIFDTFHPILAKVFLAVCFIPALKITSPYINSPIITLTVLITIIGILALDSKWFYKGINICLRLIGQDEIRQRNRLDYFTQLNILILYTSLHILRAVGFVIFALAIISQPISSTFLAGAFLISSAIGVAAVFVPAGIGVTEGIMVAILQTQLTFGQAIFVAAGYRILTVIVDVCLWAMALLRQNYAQNRITFRQS